MAEASEQTGYSDPMALDLPFSAESAAVARQQLIEWMRSLGARDEHREDAGLVVSELVGNSVRHARPLADGTMHVAWLAGPTGLDIAVTDGGARTTPQKVDAAVSDLAGRGLAIVETLASRWWVESTRSRTTVHALLILSPEPAACPPREPLRLASSGLAPHAGVRTHPWSVSLNP